MPPELSVTAAAKIIGVSRARVYQRITGDAGGWDAGRQLPAEVRASTSRGHRGGKLYRIALDVALAWREERLAAGLEVGEVPPEYHHYIPGPKPPAIPKIPGTRPIGMPNLSPF